MTITGHEKGHSHTKHTTVRRNEKSYGTSRVATPLGPLNSRITSFNSPQAPLMYRKYIKYDCMIITKTLKLPTCWDKASRLRRVYLCVDPLASHRLPSSRQAFSLQAGGRLASMAS